MEQALNQQNATSPIGIMSAMPQEADLILAAMDSSKTTWIGKRPFTAGLFEGIPAVFALSGIGKVSAAVTATLLAQTFHVSEIIFTGVAGGSGDVSIGDIVVGSSYLQHDLDLMPIAPRFYIDSLQTQSLEACREKVLRMKASALCFLQENSSFPELGIFQPKVHEGVIVSGDQFIHEKNKHQEISEKIKDLFPEGFHAIEMEGAAVAQACSELQIPFTVLRTISDQADDKASVDFGLFIDLVARHYSLGILKKHFQALPKPFL